MKKILYDLFFAQPLGNSKFHGGGEYMKLIFKHLLEVDDKDAAIEVFYNPDSFLDDWLIELLNEKKIKKHYVKTKMDVQALMDRDYWDVFYTGMPYQYIDAKLPENAKKIATVHGLRVAEMPVDKYTHLYFTGREKYKSCIKRLNPKYFSDRALKKYNLSVGKFDVLFTDSEHSKYALKILLGFNKQVEVYYAPSTMQDCEALQTKPTEDYILMLGGNRWEKNVVRGIIAIEDLYEKGLLGNIRTTICGKIPNKVKKGIKHIEKYNLLDYVEKSELDKLYKECKVFLYPTLNEGFGYPPLEAMMYGKTCIVSGICSLQEICGESVYYVNPYDIYEIENRILRAIDNQLDEDIVVKQSKKIQLRQRVDCDKLCKYLLG